MTSQDVYRRIYALAETDAEGLLTLAAEIAAPGRDAAQTVVDAWLGGGPPVACAFVCSQLRELACGELLRRAASAPPPGVRAQMLEQVVAQHLLFREYLLATLEPTSAAAYLLIRRMVMPLPEEAEQFSSSEAQFLALGDLPRQEEMDRWAQSRSWKSLFVEPSVDSPLAP